MYNYFKAVYVMVKSTFNVPYHGFHKNSLGMLELSLALGHRKKGIHYGSKERFRNIHNPDNLSIHFAIHMYFLRRTLELLSRPYWPKNLTPPSTITEYL